MTNQPPTETISPPDRKRPVLRIAIVAAVLVVSLWYSLRGVEWSSLWRALVSADPLLVLAGVLVSLGAHLARAQRWRYLIPAGSSIPLKEAFSATIIGYMLNNIIPRSGEVARPYVLARRTHRPMSSLVATIIVERILDGLSLCLLFVLVIYLASSRLDQLFPGYSATGILAAIGIPVLALVVIVAVAVKTSLGDRLIDRLEGRLSPKVAGRLRSLLDGFRAGVAFGGTTGTLWIIFWSVVIWFGYALAMEIAFIAFGFDRAYGLDPGSALITLGITAIGVTIAPTPGAFGVYHTFCKVALVALFRVPDDQAVAYALVTHGAPYLAVTALGAFYAFRENISLASAARGSAGAGRPD